MSAYFSPNHNRLLDLENHLQRQQPAPHPSTRPTRRLKQQHTSQAFRAQPPDRRPPMTMPPAAKGNTRRTLGSYQQLAAQMGQHYYPRSRSVVSKTHVPKTQQALTQPAPEKQTLTKDNLDMNELPVSSTPISLDVVESFETIPVSRLSPQPSPEPSPQPSWTGLAQSIRRARLGLPDPIPEAICPEEPISNTEPQPLEADWALDKIFTDEPKSDDESKSDDEIALEPLPEFSLEPLPESSLEPSIKDSEILTSSPVPTTALGIDKNGLKNSLLLLTYQLACPPQIVDYLAQFYKQKWPNPHKQKQTDMPVTNKQLTPVSHAEAS